MQRFIQKVILAVLCFFVLSAHPQKVPDKVSFIPHWLPQAQFAGYFAAKDNGIYKKYNIDVTILDGGPNNPSPELMEKKGADFGAMWLTNAIQLRDKGCRIINIAQTLRKSGFMLVAKKSSGIKKPEDLNGKKIGIWESFRIRPMQFIKKYNLDVKQVNIGGTINLFLFDGIDATSAMWYNEYHKIINSGYNEDELVTFFFADYGLNFPEDGLYVQEEIFNNNPDLCKRFVQASLEGWMWCFNNPEKAFEIVNKYMRAAKVPVNKAHQNWMLSVFKEMMIDETSGKISNELTEKDFDFVVKSLKETGLINSGPVYSEFYRPFRGIE